MSYQALQSSLIAEGKGILRSFWTRVRDNFSDHQSRLNALEGLNVAPTGTIVDYGGAAAPSGWLLCNGAEVSQIVYSSLYAIIGSTYNDGTEAAGNFRLPDSRGRAHIGRGTGSGLTARTIGTKLGAETHTLQLSEIPSHNHTLTDPGHTHDWVCTGGGSGNPSRSADAATRTNNTSQSSATGITIANTGGGGAHNNMQPSVAANKIIKY